jgi:hypothetical protein
MQQRYDKNGRVFPLMLCPLPGTPNPTYSREDRLSRPSEGKCNPGSTGRKGIP